MEDSQRNGLYPLLFIPKAVTPLETNCDISDNVFLPLNILTSDTEGNQTSIYQGFCNVKVVEHHNINIRYNASETESSEIPVILTEANEITIPGYNDQVWIDPARSPYVYNRCDSPQQETYMIQETHDNHITIEQHKTYITQNVYNYNEDIQYSPVSVDQKAAKKKPETVYASEGYTMYEEDELECGVFLSQLSEEIINEKETKAREEQKFVDLKTDNEALKQLMSTDVQSMSRQQKTILFLGHDSEFGQTIQNISINDPSVECLSANGVENATIEDSKSLSPNVKKRYQCNKCKNIFDQLSSFKQHMIGNHRLSNMYELSGTVKFMCSECGKNLKNREKFEQHCLGHGDPDLECNKCHKVFASKFTLRNHRKIHSRMYPCKYCVRSYSTAQELHAHTSKVHYTFLCASCSFTCDTYSELVAHEKSHKDSPNSKVSKNSSSESDVGDDLFENDYSSTDRDRAKSEEEAMVQRTDSVIAKVMNKIRDSKSKKRYNKTCEVCHKKFDRIGDLKRHLIEHVIRSTLAKNPVNKYGVLHIRCEICQEKVFSKIDRYKAHLREHAKLTLYRCTFCDKSFSDSSNFSKHKKIHGSTFFQCDVCQRKFNSKKMIAQHMEYHNKNRPIQCQYCDKIFHFKSMLNKHMKSTHSKETMSKFRCRFCQESFRSLKNKWDHEWTVHNVRKVIVDCLLCGSRFRKYAELKRHCVDVHDTVIPPAKRLLRWKLKKLKLMKEGE